MPRKAHYSDIVGSCFQADIVVWWGFLSIKNHMDYRGAVQYGTGQESKRMYRSHYQKRRGHWYIGRDPRDGELQAARMAAA